MLEWLNQAWPWYFSGSLIGITAALLLVFANKNMGVSSSFRHVCSMAASSKVPYLNYDWKKEKWNLVFVLGIVAGAYLSTHLFGDASTSELSQNTKDVLASYNIKSQDGLLPKEIFTWEHLLSLKGFVFVVLGGFLVGFGTRYAEGCTSGHAIMGLATLQRSSLIAVIFFFVGGIISTYLIIPWILG